MLELGRIVQPNLSFGVTLGAPENHGRAMGGEGCSGRWHGLDRSPEMPLSSLMVEESLRTARILGYLRSRKLRCESQVCTPEGFWCLFRKIWERATAAEDREGQQPVLRVGREMLPLAFTFLMASHPSHRGCRPPRPPPAAASSDAQHPFTPSPPNPPPSGGISTKESIPRPAQRSHHAASPRSTATLRA